jgi:tetratricopeptide (TPR) repeat protein
MSRPYVFLAILLIVSACDATAAKQSRRRPEPIGSTLGPKLSQVDSNTKAGLEHIYNLEYEKAITHLERAAKEYPDDPYAINHLAQAVLLKELYRLNALDTTLYADNGFLTGKPLAGDREVKAELLRLLDRSMELCEERIRRNKDDADAYYARGVARGLRLSYAGIVEKSFFAALRNASGSRNDHERVLQLKSDYVDAKLVIGVHNFVLGSMPLAAKIMAGIVGLSGSKKRGLEYLHEVAHAKGH